MRRRLRSAVVWCAALFWMGGWGVHARMALAQTAGMLQICVAGERSAPGGPAQDSRLQCGSCVQALSPAADAAKPGADAVFAPAAHERLSLAPAVRAERARWSAAHPPRAPPQV
jgi:hypothetical protein